MNSEPALTISPKQRFLSDQKRASAHTDHMAAPTFFEAASMALLEYQYRSISGDPQVMTIAAAKLRGAQEFLRVLMNLGLPEEKPKSAPDGQLTPPEELLRSSDPFAPSTAKPK